MQLGHMSYQEALERQLERQALVIAGKARSALFLVEHDPILTLGAGYREEHLLHRREEYVERGIQVVSTGRGGDVTFHGKGQLVAYPVFDLNLFGRDLHLWLRNLEEVFIVAVEAFGIRARRFEPHTGVWIGDEKVAAIGIKVSRWVSIHGVALNCDIDLEPFRSIVPCGIQGYGVTSLSKVCQKDISVSDAVAPVLESFKRVLRVSIHG